MTLFEKQEDYESFERVMVLAQHRVPLPILGYCVMPNHWHFVVQPTTDTQVTEFFRWMTHTHTMRWHAHYHTEGTGHVYQGRFKAFPIEEDEHLLAVLRYVERNALRANLVALAEQWKFGSLYRWINRDACEDDFVLGPWPIDRPRTWRAMVNRPQYTAELEAIRKSIKKGCPYGSDRFVTQASERLKIKHTLRDRGRPKNK